MALHKVRLLPIAFPGAVNDVRIHRFEYPGWCQKGEGEIADHNINITLEMTFWIAYSFKTLSEYLPTREYLFD